MKDVLSEFNATEAIEWKKFMASENFFLFVDEKLSFD